MSAFQIAQISPGDPRYQQVLQLRDRVLRQPLGLSLFDEDLTAEKDQCSLTAWLEENLLGCVLLQAQADGWRKLRQMAVAPEWQEKGIGRSLVDAAELAALEMGAAGIRLHARRTAVPFYERCGYETVGDEFEEVGIPHLLMQKKLV